MTNEHGKMCPECCGDGYVEILVGGGCECCSALLRFKCISCDNDWSDDDDDE